MASAARFTPARQYLPAAVLAFAAAGFSVWTGFEWWPAFIPAGLLALTGGLLAYASLRPAIEVNDLHLVIGAEVIAWDQIRRVDRTNWISPLVLYLTLLNDRRVQIIYPGDFGSGQSLLRHLRRNSREALIDGVPYRQFWGDILPAAVAAAEQVPPVDFSPLPKPSSSSAPSSTAAKQSPKYRMLLAEDEEEIERMFQRLKTAGTLGGGSEGPLNQSDKGK